MKMWKKFGNDFIPILLVFATLVFLIIGAMLVYPTPPDIPTNIIEGVVSQVEVTGGRWSKTTVFFEDGRVVTFYTPGPAKALTIGKFNKITLQESYVKNIEVSPGQLE
jgi:hypothetical protein